MVRAILLKVSVSVVGLGAILFLTKAWNRESTDKTEAPIAAGASAHPQSEKTK